METEKKLKYMLERLDFLNETIKKAKEAKKERDELRIEVSDLMDLYVETVREMNK